MCEPLHKLHGNLLIPCAPMEEIAIDISDKKIMLFPFATTLQMHWFEHVSLTCRYMPRMLHRKALRHIGLSRKSSSGSG